jgi:hypothetical protein
LETDCGTFEHWQGYCVYNGGAAFVEEKLCKICSSSFDRAETGMDCIISEPVHRRGWVLKKFAGDESWRYGDDPIAQRQNGLGVGKTHKNQKSCSSKNPCLKMMLIIFFTQMISSIENYLHTTNPFVQCVRETLWKGCEEV